MPRLARSLAVLLCLVSAGLPAEATASPSPCKHGSTAMARVDLFFGAAAVDRAAWARFLASVVTPRFPEGLTSLEGRGQWRGPRGIVAERARVLVIYYRSTPESDAKIEAIRSAYTRRFAQRSVLRADSSACVSF